MSMPSLFATSPTAARMSRVGRGVFRQATRVLQVWAARRDVRYLATLDERALKDIGLTRSDVAGALAEPLFRDPTTLLVARSLERQALVRGRARSGLGPVPLRVPDTGRPARRPSVPCRRQTAELAC